MKILAQIEERISALESRSSDGLDISQELEALKTVECLVIHLEGIHTDKEDLLPVLKHNFQELLRGCFNDDYPNDYVKARILIWALE